MSEVEKVNDYADKVIVALDVKNSGEAIAIVESIGSQLKFVKVGMELFYAEGYQLIEELKKRDLKIFLDLKMHDIPNTVGKATAQLTRMGVDIFNLHVAGGRKMMEEARNQMEKALSSNQKKPLLIGVTQLTSTDERTLKEEIGINKSIEDAVIDYAKLAKTSELDGVVSSPLEVTGIKEACGKDFITVTPGIRLAGGETHDQKRVTTPSDAFKLGTDYIVIGRAVTQADNPAQVFGDLL